jgi:hypothetical protein
VQPSPASYRASLPAQHLDVGDERILDVGPMAGSDLVFALVWPKRAESNEIKAREPTFRGARMYCQ